MHRCNRTCCSLFVPKGAINFAPIILGVFQFQSCFSQEFLEGDEFSSAWGCVSFSLVRANFISTYVDVQMYKICSQYLQFLSIFKGITVNNEFSQASNWTRESFICKHSISGIIQVILVIFLVSTSQVGKNREILYLLFCRDYLCYPDNPYPCIPCTNFLRMLTLVHVWDKTSEGWNVVKIYHIWTAKGQDLRPVTRVYLSPRKDLGPETRDQWSGVSSVDRQTPVKTVLFPSTNPNHVVNCTPSELEV